MTEPSRRTVWLRRWWPLYAVLGVLGFAIPQTLALILGEPGDGFVGGTFSETIGGWLGTSDGALTTAWVVFTVALVLFVAWWIPHARRWWPWERPRDDRGG